MTQPPNKPDHEPGNASLVNFLPRWVLTLLSVSCFLFAVVILAIAVPKDQQIARVFISLVFVSVGGWLALKARRRGMPLR